MSPAAAEPFEHQRHYLRALAYRMLGSAAEADDVVQDAFLRWQSADAAALDSPRAWLTTVVTRLCLDVLKSARVRRETYIGPWLPEPVATTGDPVDRESISMAFLVLLERLSPAERAAYLLHEVFDYSFGEVARILDKEEASCRQLCHRARTHVLAERPRFAPSRAEHEQLLGTFLQAVTRGDLAGLEQLLAAEVTTYSDGGGKANAARKPVHGAAQVARLFVGLARKASDPAAQLEIAEINGWPALVIRKDGRATLVLTIETDGEKIYNIHTTVNPDKLARL